MKNMINKILLLIPIIILTGCASSMPKEVDVPVVTCASSKIMQKPHLSIADLKPDSSYSDIIKAYADSVIKLQERNDILELKLKALKCEEIQNDQLRSENQ